MSTYTRIASFLNDTVFLWPNQYFVFVRTIQWRHAAWLSIYRVLTEIETLMWNFTPVVPYPYLYPQVLCGYGYIPVYPNSALQIDEESKTYYCLHYNIGLRTVRAKLGNRQKSEGMAVQIVTVSVIIIRTWTLVDGDAHAPKLDWAIFGTDTSSDAHVGT